jgi:hypothetical protein
MRCFLKLVKDACGNALVVGFGVFFTLLEETSLRDTEGYDVAILGEPATEYPVHCIVEEGQARGGHPADVDPQVVLQVGAGPPDLSRGGRLEHRRRPADERLADRLAGVGVEGGVARMADPDKIKEIQDAVSIPVMAKCRIGHFVEAQVLEAMGVDYIDESEVLTPADESHHVWKHDFKVPFVCGCRDLGEALRRIGEGAAMIRTKGEAGTGNIVEAVRHMRAVQDGMRRLLATAEQQGAGIVGPILRDPPPSAALQSAGGRNVAWHADTHIQDVPSSTQPYPVDYKRAWKNVLFNQFHDILAGTSLEAAYEGVRIEESSMGKLQA